MNKKGERIAEYYKEYYKQKKEIYQQNSKKWHENNKEYWNEYQRRYKRIKYWENKLKEEPDNKEIIEKITQLKSEFKHIHG